MSTSSTADIRAPPSASVEEHLEPKSKRGRKRKSESPKPKPGSSKPCQSKLALNQFILDRKEKSIVQKYVRDMSASIATRLGQRLQLKLKSAAFVNSNHSNPPSCLEGEGLEELMHDLLQQKSEALLDLATLASAKTADMPQTDSVSHEHPLKCGSDFGCSLPLIHLPDPPSSQNPPSFVFADIDRISLNRLATATQCQLEQPRLPGIHPLRPIAVAAHRYYIAHRLPYPNQFDARNDCRLTLPPPSQLDFLRLTGDCKPNEQNEIFLE